ncbi:histidine kinase [Amycolatopsis albispora]|uniref:Uncharacterized protein n=1 Tax=Amycolatopsis albispora TaxID=1804986 RepID=A0A344L091_9PSEU|nr:histidine kinase [Amycolatopsis albispora]AXB41465.1 hypothetical protein A4R43_02105 [Amycolatopsis albispora]
MLLPDDIAARTERATRAAAGAARELGGDGDRAQGHLRRVLRDIGLRVAELRPSVRAALQNAEFRQSLTLDAVNRRGRTITLRLQCGSLQNPGGEIRGVILLMDGEPPALDG